MKLDLLGAKCVPSAGLTDQMVMPFVGLPSASVHVNAAPPHSCTSIPRCFRYQSQSALGSFALMKMPPMPVTRRMALSRSEHQRLHLVSPVALGFVEPVVVRVHEAFGM